MKIKYLWTTQYKNVRIDQRFQSNIMTLLVGQNGMGKSNMLEALLLIFEDLYVRVRGWKRHYENNENIRFDYDIVYECHGEEYHFHRENGNLVPQQVTLNMLPDQIIGYYSGENKRIRELMERHINSERRSKRIRYSRGHMGQVEPNRIYFAESRQSLLVLVTLLLYRGHEGYRENIEKVLRKTIHLDSLDNIHIRFKSPARTSALQLRDERQSLHDYIGLIKQGEDVDREGIFWGLGGVVNQFLSLLLDGVLQFGGNYSVDFSKRKSHELFDIEAIPMNEEFLEYLYQLFPSPMALLNTLEECDSTLGIIDKIEIWLRKDDDEVIFPYSQLSEGEQQYLTVMGLIAMTRVNQDETLFLLDEPDTHINPQWQRNYVQQLTELVGQNDHMQFFISTHSPLLVQAYNKEQVDMLLFRKEGRRTVIDDNNYTINNWRIDQVLMSEYFNLKSSRSSELDEFMERRQRVIRGIGNEEDQRYLEMHQDRYGYLPTGESLQEVKALTRILREAQQMR